MSTEQGVGTGGAGGTVGTATATATAAAPAEGLRGNAVGLVGVLFQSVTLMGPAVAVAFGLGPGIAYAGGSFPLAMVLAFIGSLLLALCIGQLALHLPSAGGLYTFISRGLNRDVGFLAGWLSIPAYLLFLPLNLIAFGFAVQSLSGEPWWIFGIVMAVVMALLTFFGVRPSIRTLAVMGAIEIAVFVLLSVFLILHPADGNTLQAFTPATWAHGRGGVSGILLATVVAFLSFTGFESAALLAEESRDPKRIIPRAIFFAVVGIGIFFVLASYAGLAGYGFEHIGTVTQKNTYLGDQPSPWVTLGARVWGHAGTYIVGLVVLNSLAANVVAGYTALSRLVYAMGRAGALPAAFGRVHKRFRTPWLAIFTAMLLSIGIAAWEAAVYGPPPNSFFVLVDITGDCVLLAYLGVSLAVPFYFRRERKQEYRPLLHLGVPVVTAALLVVVLVAQFLSAEKPDSYPGLAPQYLGGAIFLVWLVVGVVWLFTLRARRPAALEAGERIYVETGA